MKEKTSSSQKILNVWAVIVILWSVYRANVGTDLPIWLDEFVMKPLIFIIPIWWYVNNNTNTTFLHTVGLVSKQYRKDVVVGSIFGILFVSTVCLFQLLVRRGSLSITGGELFPVVVIAFSVGLTEEIVSRGFVFLSLYRESKQFVRTILLSTILSFFLRLPILLTQKGMNGPSMLKIIGMDFVFGTIACILVARQKNIISAVCFHFFYYLGLFFLMR